MACARSIVGERFADASRCWYWLRPRSRWWSPRRRTGSARTPKVEPLFESLVHDGAGPVRTYSLADVDGVMHTADEWAGKRAIVLLFFRLASASTANPAPAMAALASEFGPRGVLFLAVCCDPDVGPEAARSAARDQGLALPILHDPRGVVAAQAGVRSVPVAVVLAPDGQVMYRGRVSATRAAQEGTRPAPQPRTILLGRCNRSFTTSCRPCARRRSRAPRFSSCRPVRMAPGSPSPRSLSPGISRSHPLEELCAMSSARGCRSIFAVDLPRRCQARRPAPGYHRRRPHASVAAAPGRRRLPRRAPAFIVRERDAGTLGVHRKGRG